MNKNYVVYDSETDSLDFRNKDIVAVAYKRPGELKSYYYTTPGWDKVPHINSQDKVIVGFNLAFDLKKIWHITKLQNWFKQGGIIWDCQLAEYILTGQQVKLSDKEKISLRYLAVNEYGCLERVKHLDQILFNSVKDKLENKMKADAGYYYQNMIHYGDIAYCEKVSDIPQELVIEDVENDVKDTECIYLQQLNIAEELGLMPLIQGHMEGLLGTIEMEYNGIYVNKDIFNINKEKLQNQLTELYKQLDELVKPYWG